MTATFIINNGTVTVRFQYTADLAKAQTAVTDAAHYLWDRGYGDHGTDEDPILFSDLTNQEKLDIVDAYLRQVVLDCARAYYVNDAADTAKATAQDDFGTTHELGE